MNAVALTLLLLLAAPSDPSRDPRLDKAYRFERNGWIFVHLEGDPRTIGYQHGYLLRDEIDDVLAVLKPFLEHTTKSDWNFYRRAAQTVLWPGVPPEYQAEIDG